MISLLFIPLLLLLFIGILVFVYSRKEPNKVLTNNKYNEAEIDLDKKRQSWTKRFETKLNASYPVLGSLILFNRAILFLKTFGAALLLTQLSMLFAGGNPAGIILCAPLSLLAFPIGFIEVITQTSNQPYNDSNFVATVIGWFTYFVVFLLGITIKKHPVFKFIYLIFIMLLIMNIIGCTSHISEFDLSGMN